MKELQRIVILVGIGIAIILLQQYGPSLERKIFGNEQGSLEHEFSDGGFDGEYPLLRVVDGDTIAVNFQGKPIKVRMIGIDAPESVRPNYPVECFGKESSRFLSDLLEGTNTVFLEFDQSQGFQDRNGRLLAHVINRNLNLGELMIQHGYASEYTYNAPYRYQREFREAEQFARLNKRGLWNDQICPQN